MGGSDNKGDGLASQPRCYRVPGPPLLNRHQVGGISRSPDGLFAQQEWEPIRGRPAVRAKRTYGGRPGQRVEEQGTWASRTRKHSEAGYGRPVDRGAWTAKTVKRPQQQPAHPQYANYWAPLTCKRHTMPHAAQPQHTKYWAPRTRKRHQQEHWLQRPTQRSNPAQHVKGRTGDCPGPRKGTTTRRNVTQGVVVFMGGSGMPEEGTHGIRSWRHALQCPASLRSSGQCASAPRGVPHPVAQPQALPHCVPSADPLSDVLTVSPHSSSSSNLRRRYSRPDVWVGAGKGNGTRAGPSCLPLSLPHRGGGVAAAPSHAPPPPSLPVQIVQDVCEVSSQSGGSGRW